MGAYCIRKVNQKYADGTIQYNGRPMSRESMLTEQASGLFSTVGGVAGAGWGIGWEIGRGIAASPDYRMNIRPVLQDFIGIERDMYNQRDLRMKELINNISIK